MLVSSTIGLFRYVLAAISATSSSKLIMNVIRGYFCSAAVVLEYAFFICKNNIGLLIQRELYHFFI